MDTLEILNEYMLRQLFILTIIHQANHVPMSTFLELYNIAESDTKTPMLNSLN